MPGVLTTFRTSLELHIGNIWSRLFSSHVSAFSVLQTSMFQLSLLVRSQVCCIYVVIYCCDEPLLNLGSSE